MKKLPFLLLLILIGCSKDPNVNPDKNTFKDPRDGHVYKTVKIGEQTWMAENLAYLPDVSPITKGSYTEPYYYVYGYYGTSVSEAKANPNFTKYGVFYNGESSKTACPDGWYLPIDEEWKVLEIHLGMSQLAADSVELRYSGSVGKKLKSTSGWANNGNGDNKSGFNAIPSGIAGAWYDFGVRDSATVFWSASVYGEYSSWSRLLYFITDAVYREGNDNVDGLSVRCFKYD